ncbi:MAG: beta-lactamase family protein [Acholeplasmataceae bacterium]|jgi:CubicO group peptidase (beta-lactamase class C family)|nr:beta-lactamase family protein [Acholeplasmataceae bacterium]
MKTQIIELLKEGVSNKAFPGGQFCIVEKNKIVCGHVGYKSYDPLIECDGTEIYDVASLTKVISTTTLVFHLIEKGKLSLATKVSDILPDFKHQEITISDLLIHSSGIPADIKRAYTLKTKEDVLKAAYSAEIVYEKGSKVIYSDIGYILLGLIVEKLFGTPINQVADRVIFAKLGMNDTSYRPNKNRTAPTELREDEVYHGYLKGLVHDEKSFAMQGLSGHAGLFSTAKDIAKFIQSILKEDFVLSKTTLNELFISRIVAEGRYGLTNRSYGWDKPVADYDQIITHTGFTGCNMWIDRNLKFGYVLLTNAVHPKRELNKIFPYQVKIRELLTKYYSEVKL